MNRLIWAVIAVTPLAMAPTCQSSRPAEAPDAAEGAPGGQPKPVPGYGCRTYVCPGQSEPFACGDCVDNDGDGQVDYGWDQNCTGACDDDESSLDTGLPSAPPVGCRAECYFDGGRGGAQRCTYDLRCDPREPRAVRGGRTRFESCDYIGDEGRSSVALWGPLTCEDLVSGLDASGDASCSALCGDVTPPGCDCFGCCELPARSGNFVYLGTRSADGETTCSYEAAAREFAETGGDPSVEDRACRLCTPVATCQRPCQEGERCLGDTIPPVCVLPEPPLPPSSRPIDHCPPGTTTSCVEDEDCPWSGQSCNLGCCEVIILL